MRARNRALGQALRIENIAGELIRGFGAALDIGEALNKDPLRFGTESRPPYTFSA